MTDSGTYHCPACGTPTTAEAPCPRCGRAPDPQARRLVEVQAELGDLVARIAATHAQLDALTSSYQAREAERRELARAMVTAVFAERAASTPPPAVVTPQHAVSQPDMPWPGTNVLGSSDASPRTVQNLLFVLGGVLLGIGAIVFTIFAWAHYGMTGRVTILSVATAIALSIPVLAKRRALAATAETFAAIGLLLVALDGYGAHRLDLFGLAERLSGPTYAAIVLAFVAAIGLGHGTALGLIGPRFVALIAIQPIPPLLLTAHDSRPADYAAALALLAAANAGVAEVWSHRGGRVVARVLTGLALFVASATALLALVAETGTTDVLRAAGAAVLAATVLFVLSMRSETDVLRAGGVALAVLEIGLAAARSATLAWPGHGVYALTAATALTAAAAIAVRGRTRATAGLTAAAGFESVVLALSGGGYALAYALVRLDDLPPLWHSDLARLTTIPLVVPVVIAVGFVAAAALARRTVVAWCGAVPLLLALGMLSVGGIRPQWWTTSAVELVGVLVLIVIALLRPRENGDVLAGGALVLMVHASVVALVRPSLTAAIVGAVAVLATIVTLRSARLAGPALAVALLAFPLAVAAAAATVVAGPVGAMRFGLGAGAIEAVAVLALRRRESLRWYAIAAITLATAVASLMPLQVHTHERLDLYVLIGRLIVVGALFAVGLRGRVARLAAIPADVIALLALGRIALILVTVLAAPYVWLSAIFTGAPAGVGVAPHHLAAHLNVADVAAALLVAASLAISGGNWRGRRGAITLAAPAALVTVPVIVAVAAAPWPTLAAVMLALGLGAILVAVRSAHPAIGWTGIVLAGAGLAGLTPTRLSTGIGLGAVIAAALFTGVAARTLTIRAAGWLAAVTGADLLVHVMPHTNGIASICMLAVAVIASVAAPALGRTERARTGRASAPTGLEALDLAAQLTALVALLTSGSLGPAAICAAGWGLLVAGRALWPDVPAEPRRLMVIAAMSLEALAWWLIAIRHNIHQIEAYTLPAMAVALVAGVMAARRRPELSSWACYGAALAVAFLPSLAPTLGPDPHVVRQVLVGLAAVTVAILGAHFRLQAPAVIGTLVAIVLAMQDLVRAGHRLPAWISLSAAGLATIIVASTYERRRRDWTRLRHAVGDMS
jgi:hypothetical protein